MDGRGSSLLLRPSSPVLSSSCSGGPGPACVDDAQRLHASCARHARTLGVALHRGDEMDAVEENGGMKMMSATSGASALTACVSRGRLARPAARSVSPGRSKLVSTALKVLCYQRKVNLSPSPVA